MDDPVVTSPIEAQFVKSKRGRDLLLDPFNFLYSKDKLLNEGKRCYWRCINKSTSLKPFCPGSALTDVSSGMILATKKHNHPADPVLVGVKQKEQKILALAHSNPRQTTDSIVSIWIKETSSSAEQSKLPTKNSFTRKVNRHKATVKMHPPVPKSFSELENLPFKFSQTFDGERFLLANYTNDVGERSLIFCSSFGLQVLSKAKTWSSDGTFQTVPEPFYQLYSIMGEIDGKSYPAAFCLLPNKKSISYRSAFAEIRKALEAGKTDTFIPPDELLIDFESNVVKEAKAELGIKSVKGCFVHLRRNFWKKLGNVQHLQGFYCKDSTFYIFINALVALAFVPCDEIRDFHQELLEQRLPRVHEHIQEEGDDPDSMIESLDQFLDYFEKFYLGKFNRSMLSQKYPNATWETGRNPKTGFTAARFPPEMWSQYDAVTNGRQSTTNRNEAFHSYLKKSIPQNGSLWTVIDLLADVEAKARRNREEQISGKENSNPEAGPSRDRRRSIRAQELKSVVDHIREWITWSASQEFCNLTEIVFSLNSW